MTSQSSLRTKYRSFKLRRPTHVFSKNHVNGRSLCWQYFLCKRILEKVVLETQTIVTGEGYAEQCLLKVLQVLEKLLTNSKRETLFLYHDNALAHCSKIRSGYLVNSGIQLLEYSLYSTILVQCDFELFLEVKKYIENAAFACNDDLLKGRWKLWDLRIKMARYLAILISKNGGVYNLKRKLWRKIKKNSIAKFS